MLRRFQLLFVLFACFAATGSQWDLVQVFAWGRMFVGYARTMTVGEALEQTFDADKPCSLCCAVRKAKEQEKKELPNEVRLRDKLVLVFQPVPVLLTATPENNPWQLHDQRPLGADRAAPPVPPPRTAAHV